MDYFSCTCFLPSKADSNWPVNWSPFKDSWAVQHKCESAVLRQLQIMKLYLRIEIYKIGELDHTFMIINC